MQLAPEPEDEQARLAELRTYEILDTLPEERFDDLAELAATLAGVPIALITFVDEDRQWNKACVGIDQDAEDRELSFCGHVVANPGQPLVVEDTREDERFHDNPLVTGEPGIRFYAGAPITSPRGNALGTVCVLDREPATLTADQLAGLETIADRVMEQLEERRRQDELLERSRFLQGVIDSLQEHVAILDEEGTIVATNAAWDAFAEEHGATAGPGTDYQAASRPADDDAARAAHEGVQAVLDGEQDSFELEYPCHGPDERRWFRLAATGFEDAGRRFVVTAHRNVTEATLLEEARQHAIEELTEQKRILETISKALPQVLWLVDPDLDELLFASPDMHAFWNLEEGSITEDPMAWTDLIVDEERDAILERIEADLGTMRDGRLEISELEFRIEDPATGRERWIRAQAVPIQSGDAITGIAGICEDVTERRAREAERDRLLAILEAAPQGFATARPDGEIVFVNDGWRDLLDEEGDPERTLESVHPPQARRRLTEEAIPTARREGSWQGENRVLTREGEEVEVLETVIWHEGARGTQATMSLILGDLRAVKAAHRAIEASEERFREIAEHIEEVFWSISPDLGEAHYVSPGFEELFGRSRQAFYERPRDLLEWIHPEDRGDVEAALARMTENSQDVTYRVLRPDGSVRRVESRGFPVRDETGELIRVTGVTRDVTEEREARQAEQRRAREAARSVELEQLVFATSHSLRTEVRRIRSYGQLLEQRAGANLREDLREPVDEMLDGSRNLELLHEALREYGEATRGEAPHRPVDLEAIVREVVAERSRDLEADGSTATVAEIPPVRGDPDQLRQLVAELVDNAIKFRDGPVLLEVTAEDHGETVEVDLRDAGRGFDPAYSETIFGIFQQLEPDTTEGVGIGLTIARRIAENHGGSLTATGEPGEGATFTVKLPAAGDRPP